MPRSIVYLALLPLFPLAALLLAPDSWRETYAWWDASTLNAPEAKGAATARVKQWRNIGYWADTSDYPTAAESLGRRLLDFAGVQPGGAVLDVGHGAGESLLLHLSTSPPPAQLHALTSLASESAAARALVEAHAPKSSEGSRTPSIQFFTFPAVPRTARDMGHPLDPMKGYLGRAHGAKRPSDDDDQDDDDDEESDNTPLEDINPTSATRYNLIYALDAAYHFSPSLSAFRSVAQRALASGGVLVYTDILPPAHAPWWVLRAVSLSAGVPMANLRASAALASDAIAAAESGVPGSVTAAYEAALRAEGWADAEVQDWTEGVWRGFGGFLRGKGGAWGVVGGVVEMAEKSGWKVVAVRASKALIREDEM